MPAKPRISLNFSEVQASEEGEDNGQLIERRCFSSGLIYEKVKPKAVKKSVAEEKATNLCAGSQKSIYFGNSPGNYPPT